VWRERAEARSENGDFARAANDFAEARKLGPDSHFDWYCEALAHLAAGNREAHRNTCRAMARHFGSSSDNRALHNVLRAAASAADVLDDPAPLVRMAEESARIGEDYVRFVGVALYRAGRYQESIRRFEEASQLAPLKAWELYFLAMAHHRLGDVERAKRAMAQAERWIADADRREKVGDQQAWRGWHRRIEVRCIRQEAESLTGVPAAAL
jgi:tetratricopeptide (TPR) repeat protein